MKLFSHLPMLPAAVLTKFHMLETLLAVLLRRALTVTFLLGVGLLKRGCIIAVTFCSTSFRWSTCRQC